MFSFLTGKLLIKLNGFSRVPHNTLITLVLSACPSDTWFSEHLILRRVELEIRTFGAILGET